MTSTQTLPPAPGPSGGPGSPDGDRSGAAAIRIATVVVGGLVALVAVVAVAIGQFGVASVRTDFAQQAIPAQIRSIDVSTEVGDIEVTRTPGAEPGVEFDLRGPFWNRPRVPAVEISGDELTIGAEDPRRCLFFCGGAVTVRIELGDLELDALDLESEVGDVRVRDVVAREITASSSVGDVVVQSAETPTIEARSEVGSIEIRPLATTRSITATSNVGSITVLVPSGIEYDVQVSSDVGDVSVGIPTAPSAPRSIVATSDIGDVRIAPER